MQLHLSNLAQDLKHALRTLTREPLFAALVIGTLAIGIGVNTAMFTVVDHVVLRPLPYPDADRIARVAISTSRGVSTMGVSGGELLEMRESVPAFESIGAYVYGGGTFTDSDFPREETSMSFDEGMLSVLKVEPMIGRGFEPADFEPDAERVVMLGERIWRERYGADPLIVGSEIQLDQVPQTVVGIMPDSFRFPDETSPIQLFRVFAVDPANPGFGWGSAGVIARTQYSATLAQASEQLGAVAESLSVEHPETNTDRRFFGQSLKKEIVGDVRENLMVLWGAVGFVLVLACINAANMLLARGASRRQDIAVQSALGAPRYRIMQRLLTESITLSFLAGGLGLLIAQWIIEGFAYLNYGNVPRSSAISLDARVFLGCLGLSLLAGLLYGFLPAIQISRVDVSEAMKDSGTRGASGRAGGRVRAVLTIAEVAIAFTLLIGAGLMIRTSMRINNVDPGFNTDSHMALQLWADTPNGSGPQGFIEFYDEILENLNATPGVRHASLVNGMPFDWMFRGAWGYTLIGHPAFEDGESARVLKRHVSESYLQGLGIDLIAGRWIERSDDENAPRVVLVSEDFAELYGGAQAIIGERILANNAEMEIIGVVSAIRDRHLWEEPDPTIYLPFRQDPQMAMSIMVKTETDPMLMQRTLEQAVWSVNPTQGIWRTTTLEQMLGNTFDGRNVFTGALVFFAVIAALLAAIGIYGVISYNVSQQTRELGIRMALGATEGEVLRTVLVQAGRLAAIGMGVGLAGAASVGWILRKQLFQVEPLDPMTFGGVALLLFAVALVACYLPARRAARIQPSICMRPA